MSSGTFDSDLSCASGFYTLAIIGVRPYTASMQLTNPTPNAFLSSATVTIDWDNFQANVERSYDGQEIDTLIDWVKSQPRRSNIQVVLKRDHLQAGRTRLLQKSLQSLGCTVISKMQRTNRSLAPLTNFAVGEWR